MLGLGPISSRSISGSPFSLVSVSLTLAASGTLLTLSGSMDGAYYKLMAASGTLVTLSGSPPGVWWQAMRASEELVTLDADALLFVAGQPYKVRMIADNYSVRQVNDRYSVKLVPSRYAVRRDR